MTALQNRWSDITKEVLLWMHSEDMASRKNASGENDDDVAKSALELYLKATKSKRRLSSRIVWDPDEKAK